MLETNCQFANVPYALVNVRTGLDMSARRGGWKYFQSERRLQTYMLKHRVINPIEYIYNVAIRFVGEYVISSAFRQRLFKFFRKKYEPDLDKIDQIKKQSINGSYPAFSVATSVYKNDNPEWFDIAMESILNQTVKPSEIVLVIDGPVPDEIIKVINKYEKICS